MHTESLVNDDLTSAITAKIFLKDILHFRGQDYFQTTKKIQIYMYLFAEFY